MPYMQQTIVSPSAPILPAPCCAHFCHSSMPQVRLWKVPFAPLEPGIVESAEEAVLQFQGRNAFRAIDHHWKVRRAEPYCYGTDRTVPPCAGVRC
jgi:hypothetical protein